MDLGNLIPEINLRRLDYNPEWEWGLVTKTKEIWKLHLEICTSPMNISKSPDGTESLLTESASWSNFWIESREHETRKQLISNIKIEEMTDSTHGTRIKINIQGAMPRSRTQIEARRIKSARSVGMVPSPISEEFKTLDVRN